MSENQIRETTYDGSYYQEIGDFQRELYGEMGFVQGTVQEVNFLVDLLQLPDGARILDVGCGTGRHSLEGDKKAARLGHRAGSGHSSRPAMRLSICEEITKKPPGEESGG